MAGEALTVIFAVAVELHPEAVAVTVYVVVIEGVATTVLPEVVFNPVEGDHEYVGAVPDATRVVL